MEERVLCFGIARALPCKSVSCSGLFSPWEVWSFWRGGSESRKGIRSTSLVRKADEAGLLQLQ